MTTIMVSEVAAMCGVKPVTIRRWADNGFLPCKIVKKRGDRAFDRNLIAEMIRRGQTPSGPISPYPLLPRIWSKVEQSENGCWLYTGYVGSGGYGVLSEGTRDSRQVTGVHVLMYQEVFGAVPEGLHLDHVCHSFDPTCPGGVCHHRACCNPWHLEPVTPKENILRGRSILAAHAAKTHCIHGHEFTPANTMREKLGRKCRTCHNAHEARRRERVRAERTEPVELVLFDLAS